MQGARRPLGADVTQLVEVWGQRVFVTDPRLFCFSHRPLASIRHPHWPTILALDDKQTSRTRKGQPRSERISELLAESSQLATVAAEKWRIVGEIYDSKATEPRLTQLRAQVFEDHSIREHLEALWANLGGSHQRGLRFEEYFRVNAHMYTLLLPDLDLSPLNAVITRAIHRDWALDSSGRGEVSFGEWALSMFEVLDNWARGGTVDSYVQLAHTLLPVLREPRPSASPSPTISWEEKCTFLVRNASLFSDPPLVKAERTVVHTVEFRKVM